MSLILAIDDSKLVLAMITKFARECGVDILTNLNGMDGLKTLESNSGEIDLMFIDYNMEGLNGLEVAAQAMEWIDSSRIFILTANIQEAVRNRAKELGVQFLEKPIDQEKFSSIVKPYFSKG